MKEEKKLEINTEILLIHTMIKPKNWTNINLKKQNKQMKKQRSEIKNGSL